MNGIITEKDYPIQRSWVFKSILGSLSALFLFILYSLYSLLFVSRLGEFEMDTNISTEIDFRVISHYIPYLVLIIGFVLSNLIVAILKKANFHYSIEEKFLTLKQGVFSKQQRHIPYGVIQDLFIKQDLFDRIFRLASLTIENASQGTGNFAASFGNQRQQQMEMIGSSGNKVSIPGLTKKNAETLREIVLQKMKENPIEDSQSGL